MKVAAMMGDVPEGASGRIHVAMAMLTQAEAGSSIWYPLSCPCAHSTLPGPYSAGSILEVASEAGEG